MINYPDIIVEMLRHGAHWPPAPPSSLPEPGPNTLINTEPWSLLALRGEWLGRLLEQISVADRYGPRAAEAAELRAQLLDSGVLLALLHSVDQLTGSPDHKRWARRIVNRLATGDTTVSAYQARAALEALCSPDDLPDEPV